MAVLAPPVVVVASGAPPFVAVSGNAPPFVAVSGNAPPVTIVASGAPPITLFNSDGSIWAGGVSPPVNTVAPVVSGSLTVGSVLSTTDGTWSQAITVILYEWYRGVAPIAGANSSTYTLVTGDIGANIFAIVYVQNAGGGQAGASSNVVGPVTAPAATGGDALLVGEANGFATDFIHTVPAERVAVKVANVTTSSSLTAFYLNPSTSPKQVWDISGNLVWAPHNLALQSQDFSQATPWNLLSSLTVTPDAIAAPDGTMTADRIVETATTANHSMLHSNISVISGETYTYSIYAKAGERNWLAMQPVNEAISNFFDLTNGVVGSNVNSAVITDAGGGWWRCSITQVAPLATRGPLIILRTSNGQTGTYAGSTANGLYLWGMLVNRGSTPLTYIPTTTTVRAGMALDYDPITHVPLGLLYEPAATNILLNNTVPLVTQSVATGGTPYVLSFWGTGTITLSGTSTAGPLVGTGVNNRVSLAFTPTAGTLTLTVSGTVTRAQMELGTVPSSFIPTFAAGVTRTVDQYNVTSASINHSATAGSWWAEIQTTVATANGRIIGYTAGSAPLYQSSTTAFGIIDGTAVTKTVGTTVGLHKVACAFQSADRAITVDGATVATDTGTVTNLLTPGTNVWFGCAASGATPSAGYIRKIRYVPRRKTGAEMITETT